MKSRLNLKPGQKGTKQLTEEYGKRLLYVRYRYDAERGIRLKTVEIIVEEAPWTPTVRLKDEEIVPVVIEHGEKDVREQIKSLGGKWDPTAKVWQVPYGAIKGTELAKRIPRRNRKAAERGMQKHPILDKYPHLI